MLDCEARFVARMGKAQRVDYLEHVGQRRGADGLAELQRAIRELPSPRGGR
jgi:hypothetical protein